MGYNNHHAGMHMIWFRSHFNDFVNDRSIEEQWRIRVKNEKEAEQKTQEGNEASATKEEIPMNNEKQKNKPTKNKSTSKKNRLIQHDDNEFGTEYIINGDYFCDSDLVTKNIMFMALKNKKDIYRIFKEADELMEKDARMNPSPESDWYGYPLLNRAMIYIRIMADKLDCNYHEFFLDNTVLIKKYIYNLLDSISLDSWEGEVSEDYGDAEIRIESFDDRLLGRDINKQTLEARRERKTMNLGLCKEYYDGKPFYSVYYGSVTVNTQSRKNNSVWGACLLEEEEGKVKDLVEKLIEMNQDWIY